MAKDEGKKEKKAKKAKAPAAEGALRLADHPRASRQIRSAKGWGGLIGFVATLLLSLKAGLPAADAGLRALGVGVVCFVLAWALVVLVWRQLAVAELESARRRLLTRVEELESARADEVRA